MSLSVVIAGIAGTIVLTLVMKMAPKMGMPEMNIVGMLSTMFGKPNMMMGWAMHFVAGIVFAYLYTLVGGGPASVGSAALYGAVHWLVVGLMMGVGVPMMHAGIKAGDVEAPGMYMTNKGGMMSFVGGLIGHILFALTVFYTLPLV